jgi:hypothetical protein
MFTPPVRALGLFVASRLLAEPATRWATSALCTRVLLPRRLAWVARELQQSAPMLIHAATLYYSALLAERDLARALVPVCARLDRLENGVTVVVPPPTAHVSAAAAAAKADTSEKNTRVMFF